ncbi:hypothetical protein EGW08_007251 [Elysia chlorotica]|uniref:Uncharacterized protein n=1 Tax=Elysia chlorotica TaxID=188477 RepID=A0A3S1BJ56_ELYCH|nr:hypothetical protein EGW08_007251 [Elysia chlorotica]
MFTISTIYIALWHNNYLWVSEQMASTHMSVAADGLWYLSQVLWVLVPIVYGCWGRWSMGVGADCLWVLVQMVYGCWGRWSMGVCGDGLWVLVQMVYGCWCR